MLGIGDDAAILNPNDIRQMVVSTDTLVADVHFKSSDQAATIGHKSLAVNFSDIAAMGAKPKWVLLNLTLPEINKKWCNGFIKGFSQLITKHHAQLIGGDTTQGPLSITVTVLGETDKAITRNTAKVDDLIVVSGELGSAAFALNNPRSNKECNAQLHSPEPRLDVAEKIKHIATSMIDVSDGLLADLTHICVASQVAAVVELSQIPVNPAIKKDPNWKQYVLAGGDDYQLCFTINMENEVQLPEGCHIIGQILATEEESKIDVAEVMVLENHQPIQTDFSNKQGYQHFNHE